MSDRAALSERERLIRRREELAAAALDLAARLEAGELVEAEAAAVLVELAAVRLRVMLGAGEGWDA